MSISVSTSNVHELPDQLGDEATWTATSSDDHALDATSSNASQRLTREDRATGSHIPSRPPCIQRKSQFTPKHDQQLWQLYRRAGGAYPSEMQFASVYKSMPYTHQTVRNRMSRLIALHRDVHWESVPLATFSDHDREYIQNYHAQKTEEGESFSSIVRALAAEFLVTYQRVQQVLPDQSQPWELYLNSLNSVGVSDDMHSLQRYGSGDGTNSNSGSGSSGSVSRSSYSSRSVSSYRSDSAAPQPSKCRFYTPQEDDMILSIQCEVHNGNLADEFRKLAAKLKRSEGSLQKRRTLLKRRTSATTTNFGSTAVPAAPRVMSEAETQVANFRIPYTAEEDQLILSVGVQCGRRERTVAYQNLAARLNRTVIGVLSRSKELRKKQRAGLSIGAAVSCVQASDADSSSANTSEEEDCA